MDYLDKVNIQSWFDIGLFLDKLKQGTPLRAVEKSLSLEDVKRRLSRGVGLATYSVGFDGVSIEMYKYAAAIKELLGDKTPIHWIVGEVDPRIGYFKNRPKTILHVLPEMKGFERWGDNYKLLFHTKLKRGSQEYNDLPVNIWRETKALTRNLLTYIEKNNIELLLATNVESNPGNLSLTLSLIIISELYNIYIIGSNHDYYWEGGAERKPKEKRGPRDHFYKNAKIGEIFSVIQTIYPWDSPRWLHANINTLQSNKLIDTIGINPFHVGELTTSINTNIFRRLGEDEKENAWQKVNLIFDGFSNITDPKKICSKVNQEAPLLIGTNQKEQFESKNTWVFLQPTRIIERKNIEKDLEIIEGLLKKTPLKQSEQKILLIIAGPIASGSDNYFKFLIKKIKRFYTKLGKYGDRVSIGFIFGKIFDEKFYNKNLTPLRMSELYGISSLIFLLSDLETRGLPIIESAASRVPLVIKRFYPEEVYTEVLGLKGSAEQRMNVLELPQSVSDSFIDKIYLTLTNKSANKALVDHNHTVVRSRYSIPALTKNFDYLVEKLWLLERDHALHIKYAKTALEYVLKANENKTRNSIIYDKNRTYIPGIAQLRFLSQVKSIVDPTYFRVEEKQIKSRLFSYAIKIMPENISDNKKELFLGSVDRLFTITKGEYHIQLDHTFDYRYRNQKIYLWRELTEQGMKGAIERLSELVFVNASRIKELNSYAFDLNKEVISKIKDGKINNQAQKNWLVSDRFNNLLEKNARLAKVDGDSVNSKQTLAVDNWELFTKRIIERPQFLAIFPGSIGDIASELVVYDKIIANWDKLNSSYQIMFIANKKRFSCATTTSDLHSLFSEIDKTCPSLCKAYRNKKIVVINSGSRYTGVNLQQLSIEAKKALLLVRKQGGHILSKGEDLFYGLDLVDINSFRFGTIRHPYTQAIFGAQAGDQFFQFIPAGVRPFFGFPLTVETPVSFSQSLQKINLDDDQMLKRLKEYLDEHGTSLKDTIGSLNSKQIEKSMWKKRLSGKYDDGYAWTGVAVKLKKEQKLFTFHITTSKENKTLPRLIRLFERRTSKKIVLGWNGGYILNSELVGKLGLSETFIGTPLGLVISRGKVLCLPLFNRPAFAVTKRGKVIIEKIQLSFSGRMIFKDGQIIAWNKENINNSKINAVVSVFTPMSGLEAIQINNRILIILGGRKIIRIVNSTGHDNTQEPLFPAGITFSIPENLIDITKIKIGDEVKFDIDFPAPWNRVTEAMEAGPLLVTNGHSELDLPGEGWTLNHSMATQAARRDRDNERGPKIGCGITKKGDIVCVAVESRIRESVGATYQELAKILIKEGSTIAMGFDPGGSSSLWFKNNVVNIVPYSKTYNTRPISGKSDPRPIESAVLISLNKK